jgi:transcriptional regulator of acetoin/glycerol metabolism
MISRDSRPLASLWAKGDRIAQRIGLAVGRSFSRLAHTGTPVGTTLQLDITDDALEREIDLAASTDVPVLITAQTLVGARRIARAVHERRPDAHQHAFTVVSGDLTVNRVVAPLQEGSGAVVLDNIGAFGSDIQAVLLELLESRARRQSRDSRHSRILSTGLPDFYSRVEAGIFRKELFYRLNAIHINVCLPITVGDVLVTGGVDGPRVSSSH